MSPEGNPLIGYRLSRTSAPDHPANKWLVEYWKARRGPDGIASRGDMRPSELKSILSGFFVVEQIEEGRDFVYRLAGTEIETRMGLRLTGRRFTECYGPKADEVTRFYAEVMTQTAPMVLRGNFLGLGIEYADFEAVHMAVRSQSGKLQVCGAMFDMAQIPHGLNLDSGAFA